MVTYDDIIDAEVADEVIGILSETAWSAEKKKIIPSKILLMIFVSYLLGMVRLIQFGSNGM